MDLAGEAKRILADAEAELRSLIETALREQRYEAIAEIAAIAKEVSRLNGQARPTPPQAPRSARARSSKSATSRPSSKRDYPRFELDGDRLVKVGWSKKNREQYEHRAPRTAVLSVLQQISRRIGVGRVFTMDEVLPVLDADGSEVPSYQAYLALAWIRQQGVIDKKGRDGYLLQKDPTADSAFDNLWNGLPKRDG